ncbi:MAG: hypothetical protein ACI9QC_000221 [Oceanicoccus sp.]|jgi:hypothetical protein
MDLSNLFTKAVGVLKLRKSSMSEAMEAPLSHGLFILALMSILAALGYVFFPEYPTEGVVYRPDFFWVLGRSIGSFLFFFLSFGLIGAVAENVLDAKISTKSFVTLMGHASLAGFILLVPSLFPAVILWWFFIMYEALTKLGKLGLGSVVFLLCIQFVFSLLLGYAYFPFPG